MTDDKVNINELYKKCEQELSSTNNVEQAIRNLIKNECEETKDFVNIEELTTAILTENLYAQI